MPPSARWACAQTNSSPASKRIAIVDPAAEPEEVTINGIPSFKAYLTELNRLGYVEGENLIVERYLALGRPEREAENAQAAVASHPDLIVAMGGPVARQFSTASIISGICEMVGRPGESANFHPGPNLNHAGLFHDRG